ncbi:hypothetical protein [Hyphococcus luteus]|uniref:hypothetical protein n=1 Tax=Hyphococcus luteus TaxID=2058213 RepID=UPI001056E8DA|nr:hypothetical protein [Marinicaulis flavus]
MTGNIVSVLSRTYSRVSEKSSAFRKFLATGQGTFRFLILLIFVGLVGAGFAGLFFIHPSDNLTETVYDEWPRGQWFLFFLLISVASIYGFTEIIRVREYGSSRFKFARDFFVYSLLRLLIMLMVITCFYLLFMRDAFADEKILRTDLFAHYVVIVWDALTVDLTHQLQGFVADKFGFTVLSYDHDGIYGGWIRIFKVSVIAMTVWTVHKYIIFKTPEERSAEAEAYWREKIKESDGADSTSNNS